MDSWDKHVVHPSCDVVVFLLVMPGRRATVWKAGGFNAASVSMYSFTVCSDGL